MSKIFLVIETGDEEYLKEEATYRNLHLRGRTYYEEGFREWVSKVWNVSKDLTISELAQVCKKGGWSVFELTKI